MTVRSRIVPAALIGLALLVAVPAGSLAAEPNFPAKDSRYHNYPEMVAEIMAARGRLSATSSRSRRSARATRAATSGSPRSRDNVATDEAEPEVLIDALHHAREHLTTEQALYLLKTLTHDYASDSVVKRLVDTREIWIIFALNPDGLQYDLTGSPYRAWRKNRQPNPGSSHIGTDLNRNYDYDWGCCGGSSGSTGSLDLPRAGGRSPRPRRRPSATSSRAGSSAAGSRSGSTSRSTRTASSSSGRTATRRRTSRAT